MIICEPKLKFWWRKVQFLEVGSAMGALPPFGGRFPIACPRTVRASLPAYGSPLVMSVYLS